MFLEITVQQLPCFGLHKWRLLWPTVLSTDLNLSLTQIKDAYVSWKTQLLFTSLQNKNVLVTYPGLQQGQWASKRGWGGEWGFERIRRRRVCNHARSHWSHGSKTRGQVIHPTYISVIFNCRLQKLVCPLGRMKRFILYMFPSISTCKGIYHLHVW